MLKRTAPLGLLGVGVLGPAALSRGGGGHSHPLHTARPGSGWLVHLWLNKYVLFPYSVNRISGLLGRDEPGQGQFPEDWLLELWCQAITSDDGCDGT